MKTYKRYRQLDQSFVESLAATVRNGLGMTPEERWKDMHTFMQMVVVTYGEYSAEHRVAKRYLNRFFRETGFGLWFDAFTPAHIGPPMKQDRLNTFTMQSFK